MDATIRFTVLSIMLFLGLENYLWHLFRPNAGYSIGYQLQSVILEKAPRDCKRAKADHILHIMVNSRHHTHGRP